MGKITHPMKGQVRLTEDEMTAIQSAAQSKGLSISGYIRWVLNKELMNAWNQAYKNRYGYEPYLFSKLLFFGYSRPLTTANRGNLYMSNVNTATSSKSNISADLFPTLQGLDDESGEKILTAPEIAALLNRIDILNIPFNQPGFKHFNNKDHAEEMKVKRAAFRFITEAKSKPFAFWQVFEATHPYPRLKQDSMNGVLYFDGKPTTFNKLLANLESTLELTTPHASHGFYERQLERILTHRKFNPVESFLKDALARFTNPKTFQKPTPIYEESACEVFDAPIGQDWDNLVTVTEDVFEPLPQWDNIAEVLFGTNDPLTQEMVTCWLVGAVKRILEPGCPMKRALILKGDQDAGKSAFVRTLAKSWSTELPSGTSDMDFIRLCTRTWIMELAECDTLFKGKEASILKQQLSTTLDKFIPKYKEANEMIESPRVTVFIGTTNKDHFLVDDTGNKRYWVIDTAKGWKLPIDWLAANVEQLWATSYHKYTECQHPSDISEESQRASELRNSDYMVEGSWVGQLMDELEKATVNNQTPVAFKLTALMRSLGIKPENQGRNKAAILVSLKQLGYQLRPIKVEGKTEKLYCLPDAVKPMPAEHDGDKWTHLVIDLRTRKYA